MNIVVIGCSGHVWYVLDGLKAHPDARIVGIAPGSTGEDTGTFAAIAQEQGHPAKRFTDPHAMLDQCKPDVAVVACHFGDHAKWAIEILERGLPLFCEKPIATTLGDLQRVRNAWAKRKPCFVPMLGLRYEAPFRAAWEAVRDGRIGAVRLLTAQKSYKLGQRPAFYTERDLYGGTIPWVGSHAIDLLLWFAGMRPERVYAAHSTCGNRNHGELEMAGLCHFIFPGDVFGGVNVDYFRPAGAPTHGDDRLRVAGTGGIVEVLHGKALLTRDGSEGIEELPLEPIEPIFSDFLRAINGSDSEILGAEDAFAVTEACLLARQSADEGRVVFFPDNKESPL